MQFQINWSRVNKEGPIFLSCLVKLTDIDPQKALNPWLRNKTLLALTLNLKNFSSSNSPTNKKTHKNKEIGTSKQTQKKGTYFGIYLYIAMYWVKFWFCCLQKAIFFIFLVQVRFSYATLINLCHYT